MTEIPDDPQAIDQLMLNPSALNDALRQISEKEGRGRLRQLFDAISQTPSGASKAPCISNRECTTGHHVRKGWGFRRRKKK